MSETVIIAAITLVSGIVGTGIGAISAYKVAKLSSDREIGKLLRAEKEKYYCDFLSAYNEYAAYIASVNTGFGKDESPTEQKMVKLYTDLQIAYNKAILVACDPTCKALTLLLEAVNQYGATNIQPNDLNIRFCSLVTRMREELSQLGKK